MPNRRHETNGASYPTWVGFLFIFNLVVGTGALTLPAIFVKSGWLLSLVVVIVLAIISYLTVTLILEAMSCANAVKKWQSLQILRRRLDSESDGEDATQSLLPATQYLEENAVHEFETTNENCRSDEMLGMEHPILHSSYYYNLDEKFELGEMASLFFSDIGRVLFYICIAIYLYGDLSIYSAAIAKSLRDVVCKVGNSSTPSNLTYSLKDTYDVNMACWQNHTITRLNVYRLFLIGFTIIFGPFAASSVQKTKYIQILTVAFRWLSFTFMIGITVKLLLFNGVRGQPAAANIYGLPSLFGACVYSFMCHHSLPSLLSPIQNKKKLRFIISFDYIIICAFYVVLSMTGIFAFDHLEDLYTLNFIPLHSDDKNFKSQLLIIIDYFLALFPVFTLSASYPIIAITLRNNLQILFLDISRLETYNYFVRHIFFPMCAIIPPFLVTYFTESLTSLVAFTGSYAGACIQYLIPITLVYYARNTCSDLLGNGLINDFESPFRSSYWLVFVLIWSLTCMCFVTINFIV